MFVYCLVVLFIRSFLYVTLNLSDSFVLCPLTHVFIFIFSISSHFISQVWRNQLAAFLQEIVGVGGSLGGPKAIVVGNSLGGKREGKEVGKEGKKDGKE